MLKSNFSSVMNWTSGGDAGGHEGGLRSPRWSTQRGSPSWERPSYLAPPSSHPVSERHQSPWVTWVQAEVTPWPPHNVPAPGTAPAGDSSASTGHNGALWPRGQHGAARDELKHRGGPNPLLGGQLCTPHRPHSPIPGVAEPYPGGPAPPMGLKPCGVPAPHPHPALSAHSPQKGGPSPPPIPYRFGPSPKPWKVPSPQPHELRPSPSPPSRGLPAPHPHHPEPHRAPQPHNDGCRPHSPISAEHQPHTWGSQPHSAAPGPTGCSHRPAPARRRGEVRQGGGGALRPFEFSLRPHNGASRSRPPRRLAPPPPRERSSLATGGEGGVSPETPRGRFRCRRQ